MGQAAAENFNKIFMQKIFNHTLKIKNYE